jgi:hypothetical protein
MSWIRAFVGIWMESRDGVEGATRGSGVVARARRGGRRRYRRQVLRSSAV